MKQVFVWVDLSSQWLPLVALQAYNSKPTAAIVC
jgi:hypothetical protein